MGVNPMLPTRGPSYDTQEYSRGVLGIGVVTRAPKSNRESGETHNANEPAYAPARARTRAISSRLGPNIPGAAPPASRHKMESWPRWWML